MRAMSDQQLLRWLVREIHGRKMKRSSPKKRSGKGPARDYKYRAWIRSLPCAVCGRPAQAAHSGSDGGMKQKASDYSCVPLCITHHEEYDSGLTSNAAFEQAYAVNFRELTQRLRGLWFEHSGDVK